ncbi:MAG: GNAT family N-acetyltransferase [Stenotrophobium sp.]
MTLNFRPATAADAMAAAPMVYSAGPEAFDYILWSAGKVALDFLRHAFADGSGYQGYRNHWVAEREGRVVGVGAFYSGSDDLRLTLGFVKQVLAFYPLAAVPGVIKRALQVAPMMKPVTKDMWYVANFGVAPECRGQGVGAAMLNFQMAEACKQGFRRYALDVAVTNPRAQKLYEGIGLKFVREHKFRGDRERSPVPDSRRLEMTL